MSVSLILHHKLTGECREVPVATERGFREGWLPVCLRLRLQLVPMFSGGAFTSVPPGFIPAITQELGVMRSALAADSDSAWIVEQIDAILIALTETDPAEWEYSFG
jgi:hypothetical protein